MPVTFIRKAVPDDRVLRAAARMEPKLAKAFLDAVNAMKDGVSLEKLSLALAKGDVNGALAVLAVDTKFVAYLNGVGLPAGVTSFSAAVSATFAAGLAAAATSLPAVISANLAFNLMSPQAVSFLEKYEFDLIQQITANTKDAIQQTILRAFNEGGHPYEQAREIKNFIGLTAQQEQAVANFRDALSDTSTMRDALSRALRDGRYDATVLRSIKNGTNLSPGQIDKMVDRYQERFIQYRAQTIARTESIRASSKGRNEAWRQAKAKGLIGEDAKREWVASGDDRTCPECLALDGEQAELDEEYEPGVMQPPDPHPDCLVGETRVFAEKVLAAVVRKFDGEVLIFRTSNGKSLTCTPNHPILTERGWVPARFLHVTDNVLSSLRRDWVVGSGMNNQNVPPTIEEVTKAFGVSRKVTAKPVPVVHKDFHGDGADGQIAIVYANRFLRSKGNPFLTEKALQKDLLGSLVARAAFNGLGVQKLRVVRNLLASPAFVSSCRQALSLLGAGLLHSQAHGFAPSAWGNAVLLQPQTNPRTRDFEAFGEPLDRPTGSVFLDQILQRDVCTFSGHVFNLQTISGEYEAGGIITHNCRCSEKLVFEDPAEAAAEAEEEEEADEADDEED